MLHLAPARLSTQLCHACQLLQAPMLWGKVCLISGGLIDQPFKTQSRPYSAGNFHTRQQSGSGLTTSTDLNVHTISTQQGASPSSPHLFATTAPVACWAGCPPPWSTTASFLGQSQGTDADNSHNRQHPVL